MNIVAFLQSPSEAVFPPETSPVIIARYKDDPEYHREMLKRSMTGNRLYQAFGDMFDLIHWDNVDPERTGKANQRHICDVLEVHSPKVILTFGREAADALGNCIAALRTKVMECHHPNARFKTQSDLDQFAIEVRTWVHQRELAERDNDVDMPPI